MNKKGVAKGVDPRAEGERNDIAGLSWIDVFGWIRRNELGRLIWPNNKFSKSYTSKLVEKWLKKSYVLERELPENHGKAIVLSKNGADFLESHGVSAQNGKDIGQFVEKKTEIDGKPVIERTWTPSAHWKHEILATGFLTIEHERGGRNIIPERQIRRENPGIYKIPDGIIVMGNGNVFFTEIENAKKSGIDMKRLTNSVIQINKKEAKPLSGHKPDGIIVSFVKNTIDTRGFKVDHKERLKNSIKKLSETDVTIIFCEMELSGIAPVSCSFKKEIVFNNEVSRIENAIDSTGWKTVGNNQKSNWNDNSLTVSDNGTWQISFIDGRVVNGKAKDISLAKRAVAKKMNELLSDM